MYIEKAIRLAVENGYASDLSFLLKLPEYARAQLWIDPAFWSALGKGLGVEWVCVSCGKVNGTKTDCQCGDAFPPWEDPTYHYMHNFVDHLLDGKDAESYFRDLLEKKEDVR